MSFIGQRVAWTFAEWRIPPHIYCWKTHPCCKAFLLYQSCTDLLPFNLISCEKFFQVFSFLLLLFLIQLFQCFIRRPPKSPRNVLLEVHKLAYFIKIKQKKKKKNFSYSTCVMLSLSLRYFESIAGFKWLLHSLVDCCKIDAKGQRLP